MAQSRLDIILNFIKKGAGAKEAKGELDELHDSQGKTKESAKGLSLAQLGLATAVSAAGISFLKNIPSLLQYGHQINNAKVALSAYVGSAEEAQRVTDAVREASGFSISEFEAVANATRLVSLGLADNAEQAGKMTETAITLGATMGKDVSTAFEEFSLLLANQSILRLDTFGISGAKVREEMAQLAQEFPELDRETRFLNATLSIADEKMTALKESGFEATSTIDRFQAKIKDAKDAGAVWLADGLLPIIDGMFALKDAQGSGVDSIIEGVETYEQYKKVLLETNSQLFSMAGRSGMLTEEYFNQAKATQSVVSETENLVRVQEEVALSFGGINVLLNEQEVLSRAVSLSINGKLGPAYENWIQAGIDLGQALADGEENIDGLLKKQNDLRKALEKTTAELIFQATSQGLDAQASLLLARELGLVDEATFAVTQEAQRLRIAYDEGALSADEFASETRILRDDVNSLTSKGVTISVDSLNANRSVDAFTQKLQNIPTTKTVRLTAVQSAINRAIQNNRRFIGGFAEGGQFQIPERGGLGDRVPVSFMAERGETVTVSPRDGSPPAGTGNKINIGSVMLPDAISQSQFMARLERLVG